MSADAFLRAIIANLDDDLPRLVYADYLDEHGDPARGEFIRVQCELAKRPDHDSQFRALEDREHELLSEWEVDWISDGATRRLSEWDWQRGFLGAVAGPEQYLSRLESFLYSEPITQVRCTSAITQAKSWRERDWPRIVREADFGNIPVGWDELQALFSTDLFPALRKLNLNGNQEIQDVRSLFWNSPVRDQLTHLSFGETEYGFFHEAWFCGVFIHAPVESLTLFRRDIGTRALNMILDERWSRTLKHLDISDNPIAPDAYLAFEQAHRSLRLDKLDVSGTPLAGISLEPLLHAPSLESLTKLEMNGCGSARRNMEVLAGSPFWDQATELRAHSGTIPASTFEPLARSQGPPALRLLDLADNYLRTEGVRLLCDSPWAGALTWLALSANYLDDEACYVLANSGRFTNLRTLHLAHNNVRQEGGEGEQITDHAVWAMASHPSLANLRLLTLSNTGITDFGVEAALNSPFWRLFGLGVAGNDLSPEVVRILAESPRLARFIWLDLADNPRLRGDALRPLAESPYLSRMCELDCGGIDVAPDVQQLFRERLGPRFSH